MTIRSPRAFVTPELPAQPAPACLELDERRLLLLGEHLQLDAVDPVRRFVEMPGELLVQFADLPAEIGDLFFDQPELFQGIVVVQWIIVVTRGRHDLHSWDARPAVNYATTENGRRGEEGETGARGFHCHCQLLQPPL